MQIRPTWLEARIVMSRLCPTINEEQDCRAWARERGIILNENAIKTEVQARLAAFQRPASQPPPAAGAGEGENDG